MKNYICLLWLFAISTLSFAQQIPLQKIDSLEKWLNQYKRQDTLRVLTMLELEDMYGKYASVVSKVGRLTDEIIALSKKLQYPKGIYRGISLKAYSLILKGNTKEAHQLLLGAVNQTQVPTERVRVLMLLGFVYLQSGISSQKGLEYMLQANQYLKTLPQKNKESADFSVMINLDVAINNNIAMAYSSMGKPDSALKYDLHAYKIIRDFFDKKASNTWIQITKVMESIGTDYLLLKQYDKAKYFLEEGLMIAKKHHIESIYSYFYLKNIELNLKLNQIQKALKLATEVKDTIPINEIDIAERASYYNYLSQIYAKSGRFKEALEFKNKYTLTQDSIKNTAQNNTINELSAKYESAQKEAKIKQLQQEKTIAEAQRKLYLGISGFLLLSLAIAVVAIYQIRKARQKAEVANKQRDRLFSIVAHDLRSPVANLQHITATVSYALQKNNFLTIQTLVNAIEESAVSLYKLVDNLLQWSLIQQGTSFYRPSVFTLKALIDDLVLAFRSRALLKNINIIFQQGADPAITADRMALQTILRNLLDNALKFTPTGGEIRIETEETPDWVEIRISDSGSGIPQELQPVLFEENAPQKSRPGSDGEKGTGIGLYVCQELAKMNHAQISLLTSSEKGTIFALRISKIEFDGV
jgi:signal transduction histidine kinase